MNALDLARITEAARRYWLGEVREGDLTDLLGSITHAEIYLRQLPAITFETKDTAA